MPGLITRTVRRPSPASTRLLLAVVVAMAFAGGLRMGPSAQAQGRKIEVLFLGHESRHHASDTAAVPLLPTLARQGINVSFSATPSELTAQELAKYDAVLIYANHATITAAQEKALVDFVASGKGLIAVHAASASFQSSPRYISLVGGSFDRHGTGTFTAPIVRTDHPVMEGVTPFETWDETYVHKNLGTDRVVLMERIDGDRREPWTWVRNEGKGRVVYTAYGHDERTWKQPQFQTLIRNAITWSAGDTVKRQWAQLKLPVPKTSASSLIPNYERRNPPPPYQEPMSPQDSMQLTQVPPGFELQLFAAEPDVVKPIAMAWDERGRLWLAETLDYPNDIHPGQPGRDRIKILEDTNRDGRADKVTVFADGLNIPTGLTHYDGGVIVSQAPDLLFLKDTNGDDKADVRTVVSAGWGTRDTHAGPSNLRYGFDNYIWGAVGYSGYLGPNNPGTTPLFQQGVWRMRPDGSGIEFVGAFSNNTWGLGFSETFDIFGSTANNVHAVYVGMPHKLVTNVNGLPVRPGSRKIDGHYTFMPITPNVRQVDVFGGFTSAAGFSLYTARSFPKEYWNRIALVSDPTGRLLHKAIIEKQGAGYIEKDGWNLLASVDDWMAPVDAQVGPDGAVWVADWHNFIVQHNPTPAGFARGLGNAYENPLRDKKHGRIYRIVYKAAPAYRPLSLSKDRPAELVRTLEHDNLQWRLTAQRLLVERRNRDVAPQLYALARNRRMDATGLTPGALHALWTLHGLGLLDGTNQQATTVAVDALKHPSAGVRKAAMQVLPLNQTTFSQVRAANLLADPDPHTRLVALSMVAELPASEELGALLYQLGKAPEVEKDEWLSQAVYASAVKHRPGYLKAYAADLGAAPYRTLAERLAKEESTPPVQPAPQAQGGTPPQGPVAAPPAPPLRPVAERVLRAYVEDVVGPITRPPANAGRGGGGGGRGAAFAGPPLDVAVSIVPGQMKFTVTQFTARPGQQVRLTLTNPDDVPHNLLIVRPGTVEAVGALADAMRAAPDAAQQQYVPSTPDVLFWTTLLTSGQSYTLTFTAPNAPGEYPFVCTFPGHWRMMQGVMSVVR